MRPNSVKQKVQAGGVSIGTFMFEFNTNGVGRIAAEHAQNDVFAMGGLPRTAMAWVTVPFAAEALMEEDLYQVMCGAKDVFEKSGADIVGGHSGEGPELAVGFALSGTVHEDDVWNNHRIAIDDALILTKPIGTGVLLAAHGWARCRADWGIPLGENGNHKTDHGSTLQGELTAVHVSISVCPTPILVLTRPAGRTSPKSQPGSIRRESLCIH